MWTRSRLQDAVLLVKDCQPGDALLLSRKSLEWSDEVFRECAKQFPVRAFRDADFILANLNFVHEEYLEGRLHTNVVDRYYTDHLKPVMESGSIKCKNPYRPRCEPTLSPEEKVEQIASIAQTFGSPILPFPYLLLPLVKSFVDAAATTMHF
jgi:hypothetical protein